MREFVALIEDERVLSVLAWCIVGRAYKDYQGRDLAVGGYVEHKRPEEVRRRLCQELKEEAEAWFLGEDGGIGVQFDDLLDPMRSHNIRVFSGAEYLEQADAGVKWPAGRPW